MIRPRTAAITRPKATAPDPRLAIAGAIVALLPIFFGLACGSDAGDSAESETLPPLELDQSVCAGEDRAARVGVLLTAAGVEPNPQRVARALAEGCGLRDTQALLRLLVHHQTVAAAGPPASSPAFHGMAASLDDFATDHGMGFSVIGDHDVWEVTSPGTSGSSVRLLTFITHGDVVQVNNPAATIAADGIPSGWTVPAFRLTRQNDRLYGRGAFDNKGPIAAALVAMAMMREAGVRRELDIVLAAGTAEEHSWDPMFSYAASTPYTHNLISIDDRFPITVAQAGFVNWGFRMPVGETRATGRSPAAIAVRAGVLQTQVPDRASLLLQPTAEVADALLARARDAADAELASRRAADAETRFRVDVAPARDGRVRIVAHGSSLHSSQPEYANNAIWALSGVAQRLQLADNGIARMLAVVHSELDGDHFGRGLGIGFSDSLIGPATVSPTLLTVEGGQVVLRFNMRIPGGKSAGDFRASLDAAVGRLRDAYDPALAAVDDAEIGAGSATRLDPPEELAETLLDIYRRTAGDANAAAVASRPVTYAQLYPGLFALIPSPPFVSTQPGAVGFGPAFPGAPYRGHGADEFITEAELEQLVRLYLEAGLRVRSRTNYRRLISTTGGIGALAIAGLIGWRWRRRRAGRIASRDGGSSGVPPPGGTA